VEKESLLANVNVSAGIPVAAQTRVSSPLRARWRKYSAIYIFVLPYVIAMLLFGIGPGIYALLVSFADFSTGVPNYFAAGFKNYVTAFNDSRFAFTMGNITQFLAISVPIGIALVVILALLLQMRPGRVSSLLRTLYFIPGAVTGPVLMLIAIVCFTPDLSPFGALERAAGIKTFDNVVNPTTLPFLFTAIGFFSGAGMWIAIQYGALESIPKEMLEASRIDGCGAWQQMWYIKLPLIRPYIIYQFILIFSGNVQLFVEPQLLANPTFVKGNVPAQWAPNQLAYSFAFDLGNFGAAAALSLLMLLIGLAASYVVIRATGFFNIGD
jgi:multiple sugar transport system permease protein